jgi:hypothetical protein
MNQIDMILENIRLGHIEQLMESAQSDIEVIRGQRLINESMMAIQGALMQEAVHANQPELDKRTLNYGANTVFSPQEVMDNRNQLAASIRNSRQERDGHVNAAGEWGKKFDDNVQKLRDNNDYRTNFFASLKPERTRPSYEDHVAPEYHLGQSGSMEHHYLKANIADNEARLKSLSGGTRTQPHEANQNSFTDNINRRGVDAYNNKGLLSHIFAPTTRRDLTRRIQNTTLGAAPRTVPVASR